MAKRIYRQGIPVRRNYGGIILRTILVFLFIAFVLSFFVVAFHDLEAPVKSIEQVIELS